ncbi:sarcosine oxidase subunit delta [Xinfangfangia sp. CPCC 101601]|uniref:Sarcosine oxidase subunit delta n=1 Tax=Pseudogemmobacter lacusdianii TaxID=3069608 RepID=A0ABU0W1A2_9RHOB|nr:sarcosine oxidase subunit delta [Xinfangfangia sp. CPCC 101601]MDQ2067792.1 sarcosine oxidase subunit delta [Xinfangfangia sp. CPCC 101601]
MILLRCPYCREMRSEAELTWGGEAGIMRPADPAIASDTEWTEYLFMRTNTKGWLQEQWCCSAGCGQWFKVERHTVSHQIRQILRFDEAFSDVTIAQEGAA